MIAFSAMSIVLFIFKVVFSVNFTGFGVIVASGSNWSILLMVKVPTLRVVAP